MFVVLADQCTGCQRATVDFLQELRYRPLVPERNVDAILGDHPRGERNRQPDEHRLTTVNGTGLREAS